MRRPYRENKQKALSGFLHKHIGGTARIRNFYRKGLLS